MNIDTLLYNIGTLVTMQGPNRPRAGVEMSDISVISQAALAISDGKVIAAGPEQDVFQQLGIRKKVTQTSSNIPPTEFELEFDPDASNVTILEYIDAEGRLVTPGLVDPHTHLVHGGSRENELADKLAGVPYLDILKKGGGILSTVRATREADFLALKQKAARILDEMLTQGTTTLEAKSGYGLDWGTEKKQLEVAKALQQEHPVDLVSTFMGAHAVPVEFSDRTDDFVDMICDEMMPLVKQQELAEFVDVFCEEGVFTVAQSRRLLEAAQKQGLGVKIHADEIHSIGGAELAAELSAISAEHLVGASDEGLRMMAAAGTIAVLLPGTTFYLRSERHARARTMIESGIPVALATDYNPGSCPIPSMQHVMTLAYLNYRMTPEEILTACTVNAAYAIGRGATAGVIEPGRPADLVLWSAKTLAYLPYHFGMNHVDAVWKNGTKVVSGGRREVIIVSKEKQELSIPGLLPIGKPNFVDHLDYKVSQWIRPWSGQSDEKADAFLLGIPLSKTSISFSGAHDTPRAFREVFGNFQAYHAEKDIDLSEWSLLDAGNVQMHITDLHRCHQQIEQICESVLTHLPSAFPIFLGGDHSVSAPIIRALSNIKKNERIGVIQLDAHHDLRNLDDGGPSNGTPFRQLITGGVMEGANLVQIGIRNFSNSRAYSKTAQELGVQVIPMRRVQDEGVAAVVQEALEYLAQRVDVIYFSLDMDVIDQAFAPGVPALGPGGLTTWQLVEVMERIARHPKQIGMDIVCIDATQDPRHMTVRVAAFGLLHFLAERFRR